MDAADTATLQGLNNRFTLDGSIELEVHLAEICEKLRDGLLEFVPRSRFELLLLGGGYGRGEGGVLRTEKGDRPYNDLEFYLFLNGPQLVMQRLYGGRVHHLAEQLSGDAGVEVEVKIISLARLRQSPVTMFYYDLLSGHKCIYGSEELLKQCDHHRAAHRIPLYEATRLFMNRCSGLLFAQERLLRKDFSPEDADYVFRNIAKAKLALGDVVLAVRSQYHWSCRERHKRLNKMESEPALPLAEVNQLHREGVEFKLHPVMSSAGREELQRMHSQVSTVAEKIWLWLENIRLKERFQTAREYALSEISKCPETLKVKNVLINARQFGPATIFEPDRGSYPRSRLLNTLPLLLWDCDYFNPELVAHIQKQLRTQARSFATLVDDYEKIWRNFN